MLNKKAFTLTEVLLALAIVGAIAAMAIPSLMNDINRRLLSSQIKNTTVMIQDLMDRQLTKNKTRRLSNTDFSDAAHLFSTQNVLIANNCAIRNECWGTLYHSIGHNPITVPKLPSVSLKNGVTIAYTPSALGPKRDGGDSCYGLFYIDTNGPDKPNILGRDYFALRITEFGQIIDGSNCTNPNAIASDALLTALCNDGTGFPTACLTILQRRNWKMDY